MEDKDDSFARTSREPLLAHNEQHIESQVEKISEKQDNRFQSILGLLCMVASMFFMSLGLILVKALYQSNSSFGALEALFTRSVIQAGFNQVINVMLDVSYLQLTRQQVKLLSTRLALGFPSWTFLYIAVAYLPVGLTSTIQNLTPLITLVASYLILKETLRALEVTNILVSFGGVLLMIVYSTKNNTISNPDISLGMFILAVLLDCVSATFQALINVVIRSLKGIPASLTAGFQAIFMAVAAGICLFIYRTFFDTNYDYNFTRFENFLVIMNGLAQTFSQILAIKALQVDKAGRSSSLGFLTMVFGYISDVLIFNYSMQTFEILGALLIIMCSLLVFIFKILKYGD